MDPAVRGMPAAIAVGAAEQRAHAFAFDRPVADVVAPRFDARQVRESIAPRKATAAGRLSTGDLPAWAVQDTGEGLKADLRCRIAIGRIVTPNCYPGS